MERKSHSARKDCVSRVQRRVKALTTLRALYGFYGCFHGEQTVSEVPGKCERINLLTTNY